MSLMETEHLASESKQPLQAPAETAVGTGDESNPSTLALQNRFALGSELGLVLYTGGGRGDQTLVWDIARFAGRFLLLPEPARWVLPVWILHTYVFDQFEFTPYLNIGSPESGCGKTTTGEVLSALCCRATSPTCGTAAVLRRRIAADQPTLILDEWDSLDHTVRDACKNFLNTGFKKGGTFARMEGKEIVEMSTFCPKAIIGRSTVKLAEATLTRCIPFTVHKAIANEKLEKFREPHRNEAESLRHQCEDWAQAFRSRGGWVSPCFPKSLDGRQRDISEPLLVIADTFDGDWPHRVREALTTLLDDRNRNTLTPENQLLRAVKRMFRETNCTQFFWSHLFCDWANRQEDRPWSPDKPLTPAKLAEMLLVYEIRPGQISHTHRGVEHNHRGYRVAWFEDAFRRYTDDTPPER